jgi:hypothetical protein
VLEVLFGCVEVLRRCSVELRCEFNAYRSFEEARLLLLPDTEGVVRSIFRIRVFEELLIEGRSVLEFCDWEAGDWVLCTL